MARITRFVLLYYTDSARIYTKFFYASFFYTKTSNTFLKAQYCSFM